MSSWWGYFPRWKPDPREKQKKRRMEEFWKTDATEKRKNKRMGEFFGCTFLYIKNDPFCSLKSIMEIYYTILLFYRTLMELSKVCRPRNGAGFTKFFYISILPFLRFYVLSFLRSSVKLTRLDPKPCQPANGAGTNPFFQVVPTLTLLIMSFCH